MKGYLWLLAIFSFTAGVFVSVGIFNISGYISKEECSDKYVKYQLTCIEEMLNAKTDYYDKLYEADMQCSSLLHTIMNDKCPVIYEKLMKEYATEKIQ
ncbi:MAG: hypothetical protein DRO67_02015 [Candidatus Asgardarchaeum californiense]|nr:MAG: hypothetical protein DRO67_02015 [Candidatus Asgardarchaeum californiense]